MEFCDVASNICYGPGGGHDDALECYLKTTRIDPAHAEAHCNIGVIRKRRGSLAGAIAAYEACLQVNPNHPLGRANLSLALSDHATAVKAGPDCLLVVHLYTLAASSSPGHSCLTVCS